MALFLKPFDLVLLFFKKIFQDGTFCTTSKCFKKNMFHVQLSQKDSVYRVQNMFRHNQRGMGEGRRQLKDDQRINIFSEQNMSMYKYKCAATSILFLSVNTDYIMTFLETREEGRRERDKDNGRPKLNLNLNLNLNLKIFKVQPKRRAMLSHGDH